MLNKITAEQFIEKLEFSGIHKSDDINYLAFFQMNMMRMRIVYIHY